ncbi:IS66 family insertion sequence hypothetical protein [Parashewanella spongiae]|uniref:IS66 family insertion sequence element accessory protein TnpB n=1 Tax=Parashewanella spongiae TaxID=342950 RepID=A0A3A6U4H7_9GAMM|nr:hypothetical protein [Parashewanella spongiae]MCL1078891.1 transposase [Parashewanella spongiae]RJY19059.1 IS66 family insertion sequence hypothetical protein [Parashewanella spongiae]
MTNRRTPEQWQVLIRQQSESGLTVTAFCRKHKLAISCFYTHKKKSKQQSSFTQAVVTTASAPPIPAQQPVIKLETKIGDLIFPAQISPQIIIDVIKGLQS